jgi:hypothetical protein
VDYFLKKAGLLFIFHLINLVLMKFINYSVPNYIYFCYINTMKRLFIVLSLSFFGMTIFAQDMSYYTREYMRPDGSFAERLAVLEAVRDAGVTGAGSFYHEALKFLLLRTPDVRTRNEREAAEQCVILISQGLGAEKYTAAATDLWYTIDAYDVVKGTNEGNAMQAALIALGQVNGRDYLPHVVQRLNDYNTQTYRNAETRRRVQTAVIGCIIALETFQDISGFRPVFFASVGSYDPAVKQIASNALPNISADPGDIISGIIQDVSSNPAVKLEALNQMLKTKAPDSSKARVASVALAIGWTYTISDRVMQERLRDTRKLAIETIRQYGVSNNAVYANLEKSYSNNFINNTPDYDEIMLTLNALAAIKSDEAVGLLAKFLNELHGRRRSGPWADKERQVFQWVVSCIGVTGTKSTEVRFLLTTIQRTAYYTPYEQGLARTALTQLSS